jgi:hypothetical protein
MRLLARFRRLTFEWNSVKVMSANSLTAIENVAFEFSMWWRILL